MEVYFLGTIRGSNFLPSRAPPFPASQFSNDLSELQLLLPATISCSSCPSSSKEPCLSSLSTSSKVFLLLLLLQVEAKIATKMSIPTKARLVIKLVPLEPAIENLVEERCEEQRRRADRITPRRTDCSCDRCCEEPL